MATCVSSGKGAAGSVFQREEGNFHEGTFMGGTFMRGTFMRGTFIRGTFMRGPFMLLQEARRCNHSVPTLWNLQYNKIYGC